MPDRRPLPRNARPGGFVPLEAAAPRARLRAWGRFSQVSIGPARPSGVFAGGCVVAALLGTAGHLQRAWYRWRLERRLARNPWILREELNEHLLEIGEDQPPLDPTRLVSGSLAAGGLGAIFAWLMERGLEGWLQIGELLLGAAVLLLGLW